MERRSPLLARLLPLFTLLLAGCEDPFQYGPWEAEVEDDHRALNAAAINTIQQRLAADSLGYTFAVVGDPQGYYGDTHDVLDHAERRGDLAFAVVMGDLTDQGLTKEFTWYADLFVGRALPVVSLIGNHDHLGNGRSIYELMFGPRNAVFQAGGARFVLFDNVEYESEVPVDHAWLDAQLAEPFNGPTVVCMHIHPTDVQLQGAPLESLNAVMEARRPDAVFMGHGHGYDTGVFPGGTPWATVEWLRDREYLVVQVLPDTIIHQRVPVP